MSKKIALEIFEEIRKKNEKNSSDSIPHSDAFLHYLNLSIGIDSDFAKKLIKALVNAHKIFVIEIASEEKRNNLPRIEGYVECDLNIIRHLKIHFQDELVKQYESEHYKRMSFHQLIKELMPIMNTLNNTPMGQLVNKAVMMGELERLMEKNFAEYTDEWKERNLDIEINKAIAGDISDKPRADSKQKDSGNEAFDAGLNKIAGLKNYSDAISKNKNYPLDRILKIYGVDFFLRSQVRRRQFSYLIKLVEAGIFFSNSDLLFLKDLIFQLKKNISSDQELIKMKEDILGLERSIIYWLYFGQNKDIG